MEISWRVISWEGEREERGENMEIIKHNWWVQNRQGDVKNSMGNGEGKELICMAHGHELGRGCWREVGYPLEGGKVGKTRTAVIT